MALSFNLVNNVVKYFSIMYIIMGDLNRKDRLAFRIPPLDVIFSTSYAWKTHIFGLSILPRHRP